jgi:preprotein translocase subunit YajC
MGKFAAVEAASKSSGAGSSSFLILIVLVFVGFYFLMIRPQQRRRQQVAQQQRTVSPGARVRTTAGMYATVTAVDGDDVVLEVAPGVEVRYLKRAVMEVIAPGEAEAEESFGEAGSFEDAEPADSVADDVPEGHGAGSGEEGPADSRDQKMAKSDKDNVF